jgi:hypothetical protein
MRTRGVEEMRQQIGYVYETGQWVVPPLRDYPVGAVPTVPRRQRRGLVERLRAAGRRSS